MAVRRVRRVIRKFDPWTVLKVSFVFNAISALVFVLGTWVLWSIIVQRGIPERITELAETLTLTFSVDGQLYFRIVVLLAVIWTVLMTGVMTLGAVLYNLISDVVGGVEVVVLEETYNVGTQPGATRVRPAIRRPAPAPANGNGGRQPAKPVADANQQAAAATARTKAAG